METHRAPFLSCFYVQSLFFFQSGGSAVVRGVIGHVDIHVQVGELLILISFISVSLRSGTLRRSGQAQFGQLGLLLLQTLFAPLDASVLEPDFDLETKNETHLDTLYRHKCSVFEATVYMMCEFQCFSHLSFCELQSGRQEEPLGADHVLLPGELLLQPGELLAGEAGAHPFRLATFSLERMKPRVHFGH